MADVYVERNTQVINAGKPAFLHRVSWGAIIGGTVVAITTQMLLTMIGAAIGLAAYHPVGDTDAETFGIGAGIWWLVTGLISLFLGGLVAGRLAAYPRPADAMLHGVVLWGLTGVLSLFFLTTSAAGLVGGALGGLQQGLVANASRDWDRRDLREAGRDLRERAREIAGVDAAREGDRAEAGASDRVDGRPLTAGEAAAVERATSNAAQVALWGAVALVAGAAAAGLGGMTGRPKYDVVPHPGEGREARTA